MEPMPLLLVYLVSLLGAAVCPAHSTRLGARLHIRVNPVRKVITMLEMMKRKAQEEGDERTMLYDKFVCYCKGTDAELDKSISKAQERIPQLESSIKKDTAEKQQIQEDLKQQKSELKELKRAMKSAMAVRDETRAGLLKDQRKLKENSKALSKAIKQIQQGLGNKLLQSDLAFLQQISATVDVPRGDRDLLTAFLEGKDQSSGSNMILGILKQMYETMEGDLAKVTKEVAVVDINYEKLTSAQEQEANALEASDEDKTRRHGEAAVKISTMDAELDNMVEGLEEDQTFRTDLEASCKKKAKEWDVYKKMQADELAAFAETIKLLGQDPSMELFKKTMPNREASFMQVGVSSKQMRRQAMGVLRGAAIRHHGHRLAADPRLDLLELAIHGEKVGFDGLLKKIDGLIAILGEEQKQDEKKHVFCQKEIRKTKDELKQNKRSITAKEASIDDAESALEDLKVNIEQLTSGIRALDKQVAAATKERKVENAKNKEQLAANNAAVGLLEMAITRLNKFYGTKKYQASLLAMRFKMRRHHSISASDPSDNSDGSMSLLQEQATRRVRRASSPPEVDLKYQRQEDGVTGLLQHLKQDLISKASQIKTEENIAQADYEKFVKDAADKRALDSKAFSNNKNAKADLEAALHEDRETLNSLVSSVEAAQKELKGLHEDCDWLLANYKLAKEARAKEKTALQDAYRVLSGDDLD